MMFGLPAAALAMYRVADDKNKKAVGSLLFSAALTSFLTGITEPIEFTFLFVAPVLYGIHAVLEGLSYAILYVLDVAVGVTFSRGIIDFTLFGLLQGNAKTNYIWILILGIPTALIYYKDVSKVADADFWTKELKAKGVFKKGNGVQIVYCALAEILKNEINKEL